MHLQEKPFTCNVCKFTLARNMNFENHLALVCKRYTLFKCHVCDDLYSKDVTLKQHKAVHEQEKISNLSNVIMRPLKVIIKMKANV